MPNKQKKPERELYIIPQEWQALVHTAYKKNIMHGLLWDITGQAGFRISEVLSLRLRDFDWDTNNITVRTLKQKEEVYDKVLITSKLMVFAKKVFEANNFKADQKIWGFSRQYAWRLFKKYCKLAGLNPSYSPHALRHCQAIIAAEITGGDLLKISKRLRQKTLNMGLVYTHLTEKIQQDIVFGMEKYIEGGKK